MSPELWTATGAAFSIFLSSAGSCYASIYAGLFVLQFYKKLGAKSFCPIIIAGVLAIYGLIIGVLLALKLSDKSNTVTLQDSQHFFGAGLAVGSACLCSGIGMGIFIKQYLNFSLVSTRVLSTGSNEHSTNGTDSEPLLSNGLYENRGVMVDVSDFFAYIALLMCLVFLEAVGLYGLIVALFFIGK